MKTTVKPAASLRDRAEVARLRREVRELNLARQGVDREGEADPVQDGVALVAWVDGRAVATMDVHWGGGDPVPASRARQLGASGRLTQTPRAVVVLDEPIVHPDVPAGAVITDLKREAVHFAAQRLARWIYTTCTPTGIGLHRALGFVPSHASPTSPDGGETRIPMVLDLHDADLLAQVGSPFARLAQQLSAAAPQPTSAQPVADHAEDAWQRLYRLSHEAEASEAIFLRALHGEARRRFLSLGRLVEPSRGEKLVHKGAKDQDLFLVLRGAVVVAREGRRLAVLGPGEVFGEVGFLLETERTADVIALTEDVAVLRLSQASLSTLTRDDPALAARVSLALARGLCLKLIGKGE